VENKRLADRNHFKIAILLGLLCLAILACNFSAATPEPTNTFALPTNTPVPLLTDTPTPEPTETLTSSPTETPIPTQTPSPTIDLPATAAYESTQEAKSIFGEINQVLERIDYSTDEGHLSWSEIDPWPISSSTYGTSIYEPIDEGEEYQTYIMHYDVTWESTSGLAGCGLIFHSEENLGSGKQYRFYAYRFSGLPYWTVELWNANWPPTSAMGRGRLNSAINQENGSTNSFTLVVKDQIMTVYANNVRLSNVPISSLSKGRIAFFVFQESGETTCSFDNAWLWSLEDKEE
jgi:hypothetical protein